MTDLNHDFENKAAAQLQPKVMYAGDVFQDQPRIVVTEDEINIVADSNNAIHVDPEFGVLLSERLSLAAMPDEISIGGFWRLNPLLISCVPSTTPTPIPVLVQAKPALLEGKDALSGAHDYLMGHSDAAS